MTRIMLVDDHEMVRTGVRVLLESTDDLQVVGEAATAGEALDLARTLIPDVVVLDIGLPDDSGINVCRDLRAMDPRIHVLILTSLCDDQAMLDAVLAGASGYVLKQIRGNDLVASIRRVAAGESLLDAEMTETIRRRINEVTEEPGERLARLTPTEERILGMIADGMTNRAIGDRLHLTEKTVKNYVSTLMAKLEVPRRAGAAAYWAEHRLGEPV